MKFFKLLSIIALATAATHGTNYKYYEDHKDTKFVIGAFGRGFFSDFFGVLNNLEWCERVGKTPVVHWGKESHYYIPDGYNGSLNAWEYYFAPVSALAYEAGDTKTEKYFVPGKDLVPSLASSDCNEILSMTYRNKVHNFITKYIKLNLIVEAKVDAFYNRHLKGKTTIALHIRGTDKYTEFAPLNIEEFCAYANKFAEQYDSYQFFVATDEVSILEQAKALLKGPVLYYDAVRSKHGEVLWLMDSKKINHAQHGEEVLIEVLLLSRCQALLHSCSNVSSAAILFNPTIDSRMFFAHLKEPLTVKE